MQRVACLFSGGKDSVFAAFCALHNGWEPILVTVLPEPYSMMFHHPNAKWTGMQATAMGLPHVSFEATHGNELDELERVLSSLRVDGIFTGAIASEYQKERIDRIGNTLGIPTYSPLWHKDMALLNEMTNNFEIFITAVAAEGLGPELLGQPFSKMGNRPGIHPLLEGGEGETFVTDAPFFNKRIEILGWEKEWDGVRGVAKIKDARLVEK